MLRKFPAIAVPLAAVSLLFMAAGCGNTNSAAQEGAAGDSTTKEAEFVSIFDGKTLNGWEGDSIHWSVQDGNIVGEITPANLIKTNTFLIWKGGQPADFELTLEFKITKEGNSGINYRSVAVEDVPHALKGYQADIDGANHYTGQNYEERGRTTLAYRGQEVTIPAPTSSLKDGVKNNAWTAAIVTKSLGSADSLQTLIKSEDWNKCHLIVKGNHLQHYINDVLMSDVTDNDTVNGKSAGMLGVQVHVGGPMKVAYRNIMLKQE
ncbi:DUF1080 domain-containing protein [Chitinophaga sp. MM2321]|uniref:3-keto-disaccharide hydrolase n=1 Tax=Chitinophaga sp. MM2321 TaxID=3137178 RepID=UPI0032D5B02B